tara:strand:- start:102 stop:245 length:144 start_codon:yes stop_codon:yes gene_type:complete
MSTFNDQEYDELKRAYEKLAAMFDEMLKDEMNDLYKIKEIQDEEAQG